MYLHDKGSHLSTNFVHKLGVGLAQKGKLVTRFENHVGTEVNKIKYKICSLYIPL